MTQDERIAHEICRCEYATTVIQLLLGLWFVVDQAWLITIDPIRYFFHVMMLTWVVYLLRPGLTRFLWCWWHILTDALD